MGRRPKKHDHQSSGSACACTSGQCEQDYCNKNQNKQTKKKNKNKKKRKAVLSCTGPACDVFFLKHMHSVCTNDGLSEQTNKQINERKGEKHFALLYHIQRSRTIIEIHILHAIEQIRHS